MCRPAVPACTCSGLDRSCGLALIEGLWEVAYVAPRLPFIISWCVLSSVLFLSFVFFLLGSDNHIPKLPTVWFISLNVTHRLIIMINKFKKHLKITYLRSFHVSISASKPPTFSLFLSLITVPLIGWNFLKQRTNQASCWGGPWRPQVVPVCVFSAWILMNACCVCVWFKTMPDPLVRAVWSQKGPQVQGATGSSITPHKHTHLVFEPRWTESPESTSGSADGHTTKITTGKRLCLL